MKWRWPDWLSSGEWNDESAVYIGRSLKWFEHDVFLAQTEDWLMLTTFVYEYCNVANIPVECFEVIRSLYRLGLETVTLGALKKLVEECDGNYVGEVAGRADG